MNEDREQRLRNIMAAWGVEQDEAEFILAIEDGEIEGDAIEIGPSG